MNCEKCGHATVHLYEKVLRDDMGEPLRRMMVCQLCKYGESSPRFETNRQYARSKKKPDLEFHDRFDR